MQRLECLIDYRFNLVLVQNKVWIFIKLSAMKANALISFKFYLAYVQSGLQVVKVLHKPFFLHPLKVKGQLRT